MNVATTDRLDAPLAILGIGCLFPGADGLRAYWANICNRVDSLRDVPPSHWSPADYLDADPRAPDKVYAARGGFLDPIAFPPALYGIAPNNLEATDTAQLLALVAARQALLDAGYQAFPDDTMDGLRPLDRSRVAVVLGVTGALELVIPLGARLGQPRWRRALRDAGVDERTAEDVVRRIADGYVGWQENSFPGLLGNVVAGRIANRLDLGGTNCVVDAACASSLGALHLASLELAAGRADVVVTGGVDTFNDIFMFACFSKTPALSPTGSARPFDAGADGTVLGEGLGILVLKRLADAERDGDRIYAVVRGVGSSSDGKGNAVYAPKTAGQIEALRRAYAQAGVGPETVELVEGHGTGTRVGDATEVAALTEVYRGSGRPGTWCALGSVKSQIGHTKAAAGAAGLIKAAAALYHKVLPPTLVALPADTLRDAGSPFYVNADRRPWLRSASPRRAAVSSFGFGGSNFHCVLEEHRSEKAVIDWDGTVQILALSADSPGDLEWQLGTWPVDLPWSEVCGQAARSRAEFDPRKAHRLLLVAHRDRTAVRTLFESGRALLNKGPGQTPEGVCYGVGPAGGGLAVLFPGQGAQYPGMLRDLVCRFPAAFDALAAADEVFAGSPRLADRIYPPSAFTSEAKAAQEAALRATEVAQPALGAVMLGALRVLEAFGLRPDAAAGHSYGELVALCAAGRLTATELHRLSRERGRLLGAASTGEAGTMLAVLAPVETIAEVLRAEGIDLVLANKNAPTQTVLSGPTATVARAAAAFAARQVRAQRLAVAAAFHSPLVAGAEVPFRAALAGADFAPGRFPVFANSTARPYPEDPETARDLLAGQLTRPIEWVATIENLYAAGTRAFVEVGPGARLTGLVGATLQGRAHEALALDASNGARPGAYDLALVLARLTALGHPIRLTDWDPQAAGRPKRPEESGFTVTLTGANYVKLRPGAPVLVPSEVRPERNGNSIHPMNNGTHPSPSVSSTVNGSTPLAAAPNALAVTAAPSPDGTAVAQALQISRESMAVLQRLHEQTAQLHRQFLEGQETAQRTLHVLVEQQQQLLLASLGLAPALLPPLAAAPALPRPVAAPSAPIPRVANFPEAEEPAPTPLHHGEQVSDLLTTQADQRPAPRFETVAQPPAAPRSPAGFDRVAAVLIEVVAEKTGYPGEMLELDMAMDADLGIDSIKRVEILSALQERLPEAPAVKPEHLGTLITLRHIAAFLAKGAPPPPEVVNRPATPPQPVRLAEPALPLERSVLRAVPLDPDAPRPNVGLRPGAEFWVTTDDAALAGALERRLQALGFPVRLLSCAAVADEPRPETLSGFVLIAPPAPGDEFLKHALQALQRVGPGLRRAGRQGGAVLATVARLDGAFGLHHLDADLDPAAGGLAGLVKTAGHEWPDVSCKALDVHPAWTDAEAVAAALIEELLCAGPAEVGLAPNGRVRLELSAEPSPAPASDPPLRPGDVVVVSGGARGITAEAALGLAIAFRLTLVLLGRSPEPQFEAAWLAALTSEADLKRELAARANGASPKEIGEQCRQVFADREVRRNRVRLEATGVQVLYRTADIRDAEALTRVLEGVRQAVGPIRGIVHGAGVLADSLIEDKTGDQFDRVYGTKVVGLRALLTATAGDDLRMLVLFSSTTGRLGRTGQADYAAANEVLNKTAQREARRRPGCRVLSVNWGPWDGGMVTPALRKVFAAEGVSLIAPEVGAEFLVRELRGPAGGPVEVVALARTLPAPDEPEPAAPLALAFERTLDPADHAVLASHVLDGRPVLPTVLIFEWLAHAALHENPGLLFHGCDGLRILQGVPVADGAAPRLRVTAGKAVKRDGLFVAPVELGGMRADGREVAHARAEIVLATELPPAPAARLSAPERLYPRSVSEAYGELLFHGPDLQGIEQIMGCDADGIAAVVRTAPAPAAWVRRPLRQKWLADPLVLDAAFQLLILWSFEQRGAGSLPCLVGRYRQYCRTFPAGLVRIVARVTRATELHAVADLEFLDASGLVLARLDGYECVLDVALAGAFRRNRVASAATS